ncbi:MAG: nucleotidyltransferase domain-containing protein [bacterium]
MSQINLIKKIIKSEPMVEIAYLFGSQATGNITPLSDFDFAVQLNEKAREKDYFDYQIRLTSKLAKAVKAINVDVVILNSKKTPLLLKYNIIKDGKIIYCKNKKLKNYLEAGTMRRFLDWQYFEEIYHQIFIPKLAAGEV